MESIPLSQPRMLALFDRRFEGDDALWKLASLRFKQSGLGPEFYAETPNELERHLQFRSAGSAPATVHLSREINLLDRDGRKSVLEFAEKFQGRIYGFIVHDQPEADHHFEDYVKALRKLDEDLKRHDAASSFVFIEYASGLDPEIYTRFIGSIHDLERISGCIDTGHLGLWQAKTTFSKKHAGMDLFSLRVDSPELPEFIEDIQQAVRSSLPVVLRVIEEVSKPKKPIHFHLHDGHPLSTFSFYGVSDHLSFLTEIPIPFEYEGRELLRPMFGPSGLWEIVKESLRLLDSERISFTLEIHPTEGRLPLRDASRLFRHWKDTANAEKTNYWLSVLRENHLLLSEFADRVAL